MAFYNYRIGAGYDVALASLRNIEDYTPSGDKHFFAPAAYSTYDPGQFRIRGDGTLYAAGFPACTWVFGTLTRAQFEYAQDTWCAGGFSGKVTIYTRIGRRTYQRFNAILTLQKPVEADRVRLYFRNYVFTFTRLSTPS